MELHGRGDAVDGAGSGLVADGDDAGAPQRRGRGRADSEQVQLRLARSGGRGRRALGEGRRRRALRRRAQAQLEPYRGREREQRARGGDRGAGADAQRGNAAGAGVLEGDVEAVADAGSLQPGDRLVGGAADRLLGGEVLAGEQPPVEEVRAAEPGDGRLVEVQVGERLGAHRVSSV